MQIPEDLLYTKDHEWIKIEGEKATIGITDFAQSQLGDIVYLEIETLDQSLERQDIFGTVEAVKTVSDLYMPISGTVIKVNEDLNDSPETVNSDPYGDGWLIQIRIDGAADSELLNAAEYASEIGE
ncbi:MAG: glycine cleavage system protein GcvH [Bacteroidota bacterium]